MQADAMVTRSVLSLSDYRRIPWKNGGGYTTEIATHPPGSGFASFAWRISVADIEQDSPFSTFNGVDRTLVLLAGGGMRLTGEGEPLELRTPFEPVTFSGDRTLICNLVAGPVRDFNLMVRRGTARGDVVVRREGGEAIAPAETYADFAGRIANARGDLRRRRRYTGIQRESAGDRIRRAGCSHPARMIAGLPRRKRTPC